MEALYFWLRTWAPIESAVPLRGRNFLVGASLAFYGAFRLWAFHPFYRPEYRRWLTLTPWDYLRPLPLGPVYLAAQDLLILAGGALLMHDTPWTWRIGAAVSFLVAYLAVACKTLFCTKIWREAYMLAFGLGLTVRLAAWRWEASLVVLGVLLLIATWGLRRSLMGFPWDESVEKLSHMFQPVVNRPAPPAAAGWPFSYLNPKPSVLSVDRRHGLVTSLLIGWWFYAFGSLGSDDDPDKVKFLTMMHILLCGGFLAARLIRYCGVYWPPISLWGRIWTGRWIVLGYDVVFAAPACGALAMLAGPAALVFTGTPVEATLAISLTLVAAACLTMGPGFERWRLTGAHRLSPTFGRNQDFERLGA
jgi:hypothetical protein